MRKFLVLALLFCSAHVSLANEEKISEDISIAPTEAVITHKIEKKIMPLPECDDEILLTKTKEFLKAYFAKSNNQSTLFRRRKHFLLNGLDGLTKENIANYKTQAARPVSDVIVELQINEKILEENMRLCKKVSVSKILGDVYLLIYPFKEGYKVHILNLDKQGINEKSTFVY